MDRLLTVHTINCKYSKSLEGDIILTLLDIVVMYLRLQLGLYPLHFPVGKHLLVLVAVLLSV